MSERGRAKRRRQNAIVGQWIALSRDMLESPAWHILSDQGRRLLDRIGREHLRHGGSENGKLVCTYDDFERAGLRRKSVAAAIRECETLGFLAIKRSGWRSARTMKPANEYRLTYVNGCGDSPEPTNEWQRFATVEEAVACLANLKHCSGIATEAPGVIKASARVLKAA